MEIEQSSHTTDAFSAWWKLCFLLHMILVYILYMCICAHILFGCYFFLKICIFEMGEGAEREGEREPQADSTVSTEPDTGLSLMTLRSWPEPKSRVSHLTNWATQASALTAICKKTTEGMIRFIFLIEFVQGGGSVREGVYRKGDVQRGNEAVVKFRVLCGFVGSSVNTSQVANLFSSWKSFLHLSLPRKLAAVASPSRLLHLEAYSRLVQSYPMPTSLPLDLVLVDEVEL